MSRLFKNNGRGAAIMMQKLICTVLGQLCKPGGCVSGPALYNLVCLTFVLATALIMVSCQSHNEEEKVLASIKKARAFVRQDDTWSAVNEYKNTIQLGPENDTAYFELAENFVLLNSIDKAIWAYKEAAAINPGNKYARLRLGQIYFSTGKLREAGKIIASVLETYPQDIEVYHLSASILIKLEKWDTAIETLEKALLISKKNIKIILTLASLYKICAKQNLAEAMYKKAIAIDSSLRFPYVELCKLYKKDKAWDKMEVMLLKALETPGIRESKLTDLARFYEGQQNYPMAQSYYNNTVDEFPKSIQALMNLAEFHTRQSNKENAIDTMNKAIDLEPKNIVCLVGLAQVYLSFDLPEYAWPVIKKAVDLDDLDLDANFIIGKLLMEQGDFKGANDYLSWIISQGFTSADVHYLKAICIKRKTIFEDIHQKINRTAAGFFKDPEAFRRKEMEKELEQSLWIDPDMLESRIELIEIYLYENEMAKAEEHLGIAFRQSPRNPRLFILMAAFKLLQGDRDGAIKIYTTVVKQHPSYIPGHIRLALLYTASGQIDQAVNAYLRAYELNPSRISILKPIAELLFEEKGHETALALLNSIKTPQDKISLSFVANLKGEILLKAEDKARAMENFQAATALDPSAISPKINMARLFIANKQIRKAKEILSKIEGGNPDKLSVIMAWAYLYEMEEKTQKAEKLYRRILEMDPENANAANNLACLFLKEDEGLEEAFKLINQAIRVKPRNSIILDNMGLVYYRKGLYEDAVSKFKKSVRFNPNNASTFYRLGLTYYQVQEIEMGKTYLKKALAISPHFHGSNVARDLLGVKK